jgi:hypothetical protein
MQGPAEAATEAAKPAQGTASQDDRDVDSSGDGYIRTYPGLEKT